MTERPGIYAITCLTSGKVYVGSASNISKRWHRHHKDLRLGCHSNPHLQAAWAKHGEASFSFAVLELTGDLTAREQHWIDTLRPAFNLCPSARSSRGRPITEAMREASRRTAATKITADDRRRAIQTRRARYQLGHRLTWAQAEEIRARYGPWSPDGKGRPHSLPSMEALAKEYGVSQDTVCRIVRRLSYADPPRTTSTP